MMIPFSERAKATLTALETTPYRFANEHGFNRASLFNLVTKDRHPSFELVERICVAEPRISAEYLLRGEGDPLRDQRLTAATTTAEQLKEFKFEMDRALDKRIQELGG